MSRGAEEEGQGKGGGGDRGRCTEGGGRGGREGMGSSATKFRHYTIQIFFFKTFGQSFHSERSKFQNPYMCTVPSKTLYSWLFHQVLPSYIFPRI